VKAAGDGSGRLFVVEKAGTIRIVRDGVVSPAPFLDITPLVRSAESERGLLGIAFHPKYHANGQFFVYYTDQNGDIVVARYTVSADANRADPASALELLHVQHRAAANHNGGGMLFGPDGFLYIGIGDGGDQGDRFGNSQNPNVLLAKLLRFDVDGGKPYGIPPTNPFVNRAGFRQEIWAWGLRNPWRFSFDRATGDLYIADVGQDLWEEVDLQPASSKGGENYGWNKMEGTHCYPPDAACSPASFVTPVADYDHSSADCSITGGYVYRGAAQPALAGAYLFADYCTGHFRALQRGADGLWGMTTLLTTHFPVSSFGEDENGEVYVLGFGNGDLYHIVGVGR
jgi:glucose/arabinose dehydrogenase